MKAKIIITPKKAVVDPQGKTVQSALEHMGYRGVAVEHVGKPIEIDLAPGTERENAAKPLTRRRQKSSATRSSRTTNWKLNDPENYDIRKIDD